MGADDEEGDAMMVRKFIKKPVVIEAVQVTVETFITVWALMWVLQ